MDTKNQKENGGTKYEIEAHLIEFQKLREEILYHLNNQRQSFLLTLGSASVVLPFLVGQIASTEPTTIRAVLYILTIVYSVFAINFAQSAFGYSVLGAYLHSELTPKINKAIYGAKANKVLQWETFLRDERSNIFVTIISSADSVSSAILILLPAAAFSYFSSFYTSFSRISQTMPSTPVAEFLAKTLPLLSVLSSVFFITSIFMQIAVTIYVLFKSSFMKKRNL